MALIEIVLFLLLCSVALGWLARRAKLPYPIALVLGGNVLGFIPTLPQVSFDPQVLLVVVLPPILYQAALLTSWRDFKLNLRSIGLLAVGLVLATTLIVGSALKALVPEIPWAVAFTFGAIVSPPDAAAATAILSRMNLPRRIVTILEGESLVNDASGLVLYKMAVVAALSGAFSLAEASAQFVGISIGGMAVGLVLGALFVRLHPHLKDPLFEVLVSLSIPYTAYVLAESVHVSGVLAVVAAGLLRGRHSPVIVSANTRIIGRSMWNLVVFILNSFIFILIGLQLSGVVRRLGGIGGLELATYAVVISLVAIGIRFAWVYVAEYSLPRLMFGRPGATPLHGEAFIISWCGMRGIVSLAAALALPTEASGGAFPYRDLIIFLTFAVITVTLVVQGTTLGWIIRRLLPGTDHGLAEERAWARSSMVNAALAAIDRAGIEAPDEIFGRVRSEFSDQLPHPGSGDEAAGNQGALAERLRLAGIRAQREELIRLWREGRISDEVLRDFEEELDYAEARA